MAARGRKFSFMRLINNTFPNFARDSPDDVDLSPIQADDLMTYQLSLPHPRYLGELAFWVTGLVGAKSQSVKVHKTLVRRGIISAAPEGTVGGGSGSGSGKGEGEGGEAAGEQMTVNTAGITKDFANQLAIISVHAQRKVVGLLFFWEEECVRWKVLDGEEREIREAVRREGERREWSIALEGVRMRMRLLPSQRAEGTANVGEGRGHELPAYA